MNKKQICKINYANKYASWDKEAVEHECYGICLGDDKFLLEDGKIIDTHDKTMCRNNAYTTYSDYGRADLDIMTRPVIPAGRNSWYELSIADASATRNVPLAIREAMEKSYTAVEKMIKMQESFEKMKNMFLDEMKQQCETVKEMPAVCRSERGVLTKAEFVKAFYDALPESLRYQMENSEQRNYNGNMQGKYEVSMYSDIQISRSVWFDKYAKPSYSFLEYDDSRMIIDHPEKNADYVRDLKKYSRPLPVDGKKFDFEEYISIGDKNSLEYQCSYMVKIDPKKELTADYAKKLAEEFGGRTKDKEKDEEEYER